MPKWMKPGLVIMILLASLLMVAGCGGGDDMPVTRTNPLDLVTGDTSIGTGGGGGGTSTGACIYLGVCIETMYSTTCTSDFAGTFYSGQTCSQLNYTNFVGSDGNYDYYI